MLVVGQRLRLLDVGILVSDHMHKPVRDVRIHPVSRAKGLQADLHSEGGASHAHRFPPAHSDRHRWEFRRRIKIAQFAERDLEALPHLG